MVGGSEPANFTPKRNELIGFVTAGVGGTIGRSCRVVSGVQPIIQEMVAPRKYSGNSSGMDKSRLLELGPRTKLEVEAGNNYVNRQWGSSKSNRFAVTDYCTTP